MESILKQLQGLYFNSYISTENIAICMLFVLILSIYEFFVYKSTCKRAFYNRSFHISITVIPFFIAAIILCLQSNIVVALGTIGALAIVRFRTAVKDPVDMIYILWAVFIGLASGSGLYELALLTSLVATIVLLILNLLRPLKAPHNLVIHCENGADVGILEEIKNNTKKYIVKSRCYGLDGTDIFIEIYVENVDDLTKKLGQNKEIDRFALLEYNYDDII